MEIIMFDDVWYGIFGGIFGPAIAQWMKKFKYRTVFFVTMISTYIGLYVAGVYEKGLAFATQAMLDNIFTPVGIFVPMGFGLFAVFVTFLGSINTPEKPTEAGQDKKNRS